MPDTEFFYTYIYIDPRNNLPFYVGKGKDYRKDVHCLIIKNKGHYNKHLENKIKQIWSEGLQPIIRVVYNGDEWFALHIEEKLIANFKAEGIKLCNLTSGGDGASPSEETRNKMSVAKLGRKQSIEQIQKRNKSNIGRIPWNKGKKYSEEQKKNMFGKQPWNKGLTDIYSEDTLSKIREARKFQKSVGQKAVNCFDLKDTFIAYYLSIKQASEATGISDSRIIAVCKQRRKTAGKLKWQYATQGEL